MVQVGVTDITMQGKNSLSQHKGFTLIELLITILVSIIVIGTIYTVFQSQQRAYMTQDQISEIQENIRAALSIMVRDIRMAGYNPTGNANAGFVSSGTFSNGGSIVANVGTNATQIAFTADLDGNGTINNDVSDINNNGVKEMSEMEQIAYRLNGTDLERFSTLNGAIKWQDIANNIQAIKFYYTLTDGTQTDSPTNVDNIRSVQIFILGRSQYPIPNHTDTKDYSPLSTDSWGPYNDNYYRRLVTTTVRCRNIGL